MTTIVGVVDGPTVYIGGDSLSSDGWRVDSRRDPKVFTNGPYVIGFTDSWRMGQILNVAFTPTEPPADGSLWRFMAGPFIKQVREALKANGWAKKDNERESGGRFMVGVHGRLFNVDSDFHVAETAHPYDAIGGGYLVALGALSAITRCASLFGGRACVEVALQAAAQHTASCREPWTILRSNQPEEVANDGLRGAQARA